MTIIRQMSLFGIQELYDMEPIQKYEAVISAIEASYSRLVTKLTESVILEKENIVRQAIEEGFITDDTAATDSCHFEVWDQATPKEEKSKSEPKKRGRKSKEEREQWLKD